MPGPDARDKRDLLAANGYAAVRDAVLPHVRALGAVAPEAIDAAIAWCQDTIARLEVDLNPQAADALTVARVELDVLKATAHFRRELGKIDERARAREALAGPPASPGNGGPRLH